MADLMELLGGAAPAAGGGPVPGGAELPPSIPDPEAGMAQGAPTAGGDEVSVLKDMLGIADSYLQLPTVTEQERAKMQKVTTALQELLASNEKMAEQISGAQPALRKLFG